CTLTVGRRFFNFLVRLVVGHALVDVYIRVVAVVVAVDPDRWRGVFVPVVVKSPCRADDDVTALHRISFILTNEDSVLGRLADQACLAAQIAVRLGAFSGHKNLRVHPDWKLACFNADDRAHAGHAVRPNSDNLAGAHQAAKDAVPFPMRGGVALARHRPSVAPQTGADEVMLSEKSFKVFVGGTYIAHII